MTIFINIHHSYTLTPSAKENVYVKHHGLGTSLFREVLQHEGVEPEVVTENPVTFNHDNFPSVGPKCDIFFQLQLTIGELVFEDTIEMSYFGSVIEALEARQLEILKIATKALMWLQSLGIEPVLRCDYSGEIVRIMSRYVDSVQKALDPSITENMTCPHCYPSEQ